MGGGGGVLEEQVEWDAVGERGLDWNIFCLLWQGADWCQLALASGPQMHSSPFPNLF